MFTIDRLAKLDAIANAVFKALSSGLDWLGLKYEDFLVNTTYRVVEAKAAAIEKAEDKISDLEDAKAEAGSNYIEAVNALKAKYRALEQALTDAHAAKVDAINGKLADAFLRVLTLEDRYEEVVAGARDKLGVEVDA